MIDNLNIWLLILALISGVIVSCIYFGGLWLTLQNVVHRNRSGGLLLLSFIVRIGITGLVFYVLAMHHWMYMILAFISFLVVRQILIKKLGHPNSILYE